VAGFNLDDPTLECIEIKIQPDTLDYYMDVHIVELGHLRDVLVDIIHRIDSGEIRANRNDVGPADDDGVDPLS